MPFNYFGMYLQLTVTCYSFLLSILMEPAKDVTNLATWSTYGKDELFGTYFHQIPDENDTRNLYDDIDEPGLLSDGQVSEKTHKFNIQPRVTPPSSESSIA